MIDLRNEPLRIKEKSPLFSDYVYNYEKVRDFFYWNYQTDLKDCIEKRAKDYQNRKTVAEVLYRQNKKWGASPGSLKNIEQFSDGKALAVVTGQQAGIFGGPLYTVYKILHAVKLAAHLREKYGEYEVIPVFWMEVGDSDYQEINHINVLNIQSKLQRMDLPEDPNDGRSIFLRTVPQEMADVFGRLEELFPSNEFRDQLLADAKSIYSAGKSLADAFGEWIHYLFKDLGIVVIDPTDAKLSEISRPILKKAIAGHRDLREIFSKTTRQVEQAGYPPQVNLLNQQTLLFYRMDNDNRARIDTENGQFTARDEDTAETWSADSLLAKIERSPHKFTPNVVLRPILQDWLLPTVCYIGGPGEISYDAQLNDLYAYFNILPPVFIPRMRLTLIEDKIQKVFEKLNLTPADIFDQEGKIVETYIQKRTDPRLRDTLQKIQEGINEMMDGLKPIISDIDPTLESLTDKTGRNILDSLQKLENKANAAYERKLQIEINQIHKILANLFPGDKPQERVLNIYQYLFRYGPEVIHSIYEAMNLDTRHHQLIFF